jgi:tetratricopeptide (TPR) repeat protein
LRGLSQAYLGNDRLAMKDLNYAIEGNDHDMEGFRYRAMAYMQMKMYKQAESDLDRALALNPKAPETYRLRGNLFLQMQDTARAILAYDQLIKANKDWDEGYLLRGRTYFGLGKSSKASEDLRRCISLHGGRESMAWLYLGILAERDQDLATATTDYQKCLTLNPQSVDAACNLGRMAYKKGDYQQALTYFETAIAGDPSSIYAISQKALCLIELKRTPEVLPLLQAVIHQKGDEMHFLYRTRAVAKIVLEQYESAILDCDTALAIQRDYADAYYTRGRAKECLKQYARAAPDYQMAYALAPDWNDALGELVGAYMDLEEWETARPLALEYLSRMPNATWALYNVGQIERNLKHFPAAVAAYRKALVTHNSDSVRVYSQLASCYVQMNEMALAAAADDQCLRMSKDKIEYLVTIGYHYGLEGRYEEAIALLDRYIAADSTHPYAYNNRGYAKLMLGQYEASILDFDRSMALKNDYAHWPPRNRGNALRALGRYPEAIADYTLSLSYHSDYVEALTDRGETYLLMGDREKAKADFLAALHYQADYKPAKDALARMGK